MSASSYSSRTSPHAARPAQKPLCGTAPRIQRVAPALIANDPRRARAILKVAGKWLNRTVLHYSFFTGDSHYAVPTVQADAVRAAFAAWKAVGIGLDFQEVDQLGEAEVRIGYSEADASSASAVGRDVLQIPLTEPTTVYGWDLTTPYGRGTALHELGHVLGMEHEHQNPFAGIEWHEEAVYASLGRPPNNWSRETTFRNILAKLSTDDVAGSSWDPDSIMEYEFEPGLIARPVRYESEGLVPPGTLSAADRAWVQKWYPADAAPATPAALVPFESVSASLEAGQQVDYVIAPTQSRTYTIATHGACDTLLALFEDVDGEARFVAADDDSGEDRNARIRHKLFKGRTYRVRLRLYYPGQTGQTSLMLS